MVEIFSSAGTKPKESKKTPPKKAEKKAEKEKVKVEVDLSAIESIMKSDNKKRPRAPSDSLEGPSSDEEPMIAKKRRTK